MSSFFVVLLAMCVTGILEQYGILSSLVESLVKRTLGSTFRITLATMVIALITNMIGSSMLITSIVAGSLMKNVFKNNNLAQKIFRVISHRLFRGNPTQSIVRRCMPISYMSF